MKEFYLIIAAVLIYLIWQGNELHRAKRLKEFWLFALLSAVALYYFIGSRYVWNLFHPMLYVKEFSEPLSRWMIRYVFGVNV
ncbi:hypothetical protein PP175_21975 [Aneurinibacillus sp. Ricciae_BoGa-3]|uniref:hypothetical protein n=1 Tax=Aneurinibacillus sp. Ricciae_BoGa-3 TaxID=3022697 RepID=UPI00234163ED|nr:hypothetical protein [Aneurinibacillus sp. Ricciae_BoGa-3]WCK53958.1 hypothetical protein PP175_21975 [Aneurinibacillus sp. Ricciae_BoGa-3]